MLSRNRINELALLPDRASRRTFATSCSRPSKSGGPAARPRRRGRWCSRICPSRSRPRVFLRGNPNQLGDEVPRRFLRVLCDGRAGAVSRNGSGRLELARAIADRDNPLTARVMVNRVWLHHFGAALVRTPSDFGLRSEPPTHPELLDYLAWTFMERGWSLKKLHREIVLSAAYQQASDDRRRVPRRSIRRTPGCGG